MATIDERLNPNYRASKLVKGLVIEGTDDMIGCIVRFHPNKKRGTYHHENTFEVVSKQLVWGFDAKGKYTMIDGYRLFAITTKDDFGTPASAIEFYVINSKN